jgi:hypothetical protein
LFLSEVESVNFDVVAKGMFGLTWPMHFKGLLTLRALVLQNIDRLLMIEKQQYNAPNH